MTHLPVRRAWWLMTIAIGFAVFFLLIGRQLTERGREFDLDELKQESALRVIYPQATKLYHVEQPKKSVPLEGMRFGAQIQDFYGTQARDEEIEVFYRERLTQLGWQFVGSAGGRLNTYRSLFFSKDRLTAQVRFWFKKDFQQDLPSVEVNRFATVFELLIFGSPD